MANNHPLDEVLIIIDEDMIQNVKNTVKMVIKEPLFIAGYVRLVSQDAKEILVTESYAAR